MRRRCAPRCGPFSLPTRRRPMRCAAPIAGRSPMRAFRGRSALPASSAWSGRAPMAGTSGRRWRAMSCSRNCSPPARRWGRTGSPIARPGRCCCAMAARRSAANICPAWPPARCSPASASANPARVRTSPRCARAPKRCRAAGASTARNYGPAAHTMPMPCSRCCAAKPGRNASPGCRNSSSTSTRRASASARSSIWSATMISTRCSSTMCWSARMRWSAWKARAGAR